MAEKRPDVNERLASVETKVDLILTNHLPHIEKTLKTLTFWLIGLLTSANLALIGLLIKK